MRKIAFILLLISTGLFSLNIGLYKLLTKYYALYQQAIVFPDHSTYYHKENQQLTDNDQPRLILFGDSRIRYWHNFRGRSGDQVINRGIAGETSPQLLQRLAADVLALDPEVVVIQAGINDLTAIGVMPHRHDEITRQCIQNLRAIVETLLEQKIQVILLTVIPPSEPDLLRAWVWNTKIVQAVSEVNQFWLDYRTSTYLHIIDSQTVLTENNGNWHAGIFADTVHLTASGYAYLNDAVSQSLKTLR